MARIIIAEGVAKDFERILEHLETHRGVDASGRVEALIRAIDVLETSPHLGRPATSGNRELVIGRRERGYIALYRYVEEGDLVVVLAVRSQREAGYV